MRLKVNAQFILPITLEEYLRSHRMDELKQYLEVTETYLAKAGRDFEASIYARANKLPEEERNEFLDFNLDDIWQHQEIFPRILRNSLFLAIISLLEFEIGDLCRTLKKSKDIRINLSDLKGDILEQVKIYLNNARLEHVSLNPFWQDINNYYLVRNCIAHNHGVIKGAGKEQALRDYLGKKGIISKDTIIEEVALTSQFCNEVVEKIQNFLVELSKIVIGES